MDGKYAEATKLGTAADAAKKPEDSLQLYLQAWQAVPEPRREWDGGTWIWNGIAAIHFEKRRFSEALEAAQRAEQCWRGAENSNTQMLLGAIYLDGFGDTRNASAHFRNAWEISGERAFLDEPDRYLQQLTGQTSGEPIDKVVAGNQTSDNEAILSEDIYSKVQMRCQAGDQLLEEGKIIAALDEYNRALSLLPKPQSKWDAYTWIQAAIGDAHFAASDWTQTEGAFRLALTGSGGIDNPFVHLRLGQSLYQQGRLDAAMDELMRAYMLGGEEVFSENTLYLELLRQRAVI